MLAQPTHHAVGLAEGDALAHQVVGHVGSQHIAFTG